MTQSPRIIVERSVDKEVHIFNVSSDLGDASGTKLSRANIASNLRTKALTPIAQMIALEVLALQGVEYAEFGRHRFWVRKARAADWATLDAQIAHIAAATIHAEEPEVADADNISVVFENLESPKFSLSSIAASYYGFMGFQRVIAKSCTSKLWDVSSE